MSQLILPDRPGLLLPEIPRLVLPELFRPAVRRESLRILDELLEQGIDFTKAWMLALTHGAGFMAGGSAPPFSATGGSTSTSGSYTIHRFTSNGDFVVTGSAKDVEYFIVGGGAAGAGGAPGAGGLGGRVLTGTFTALGAGTYPVVVGAASSASSVNSISAAGAYGGGGTTSSFGGSSVAYGYNGSGGPLGGAPSANGAANTGEGGQGQGYLSIEGENYPSGNPPGAGGTGVVLLRYLTA